MKRTQWWMAGLALFLSAGFANAANYSWTNTVAGSSDLWTNGVLWGQGAGTYPGSASSDGAYITNSISGGTETITLNAPLANSISTLALSNTPGQSWLILTNVTANPSIIITNTTFQLGAGGRLEIDNGAILTNSAFIFGNNGGLYINGGGKLGTTNAVTIGGSGNQVQVNTNGLWVLNGQGLTLNAGNSLVISGGIVTNGGAFAWGGTGGGSLVVSNSGKLYASGTALNNTGAKTNTILVTGGELSFGNTQVRYYGASNTITIANGGTMSAGYFAMGRTGGGDQNKLILTNGGRMVILGTTATDLGNGGNTNQIVVIGGSGGTSLWNNNNQAFGISTAAGGVGNVLRVDGDGLPGGAVFTNVSTLTVGNNATAANNSLIVTNGGYLYATTLNVGPAGSGNKFILDGSSSAVTVNNLLATNSAGAVVFNGGVLNSSGTYVTNGLAFTVGDSTQTAVYNMTGGTHSFSNGLTIASGSYLKGNGTVFSAVGLTINNGGTLAPGASPGVITNNGALTLQAGATLELFMTNYTAGTTGYSQLVETNGAITLNNSNLKITLQSGFVPTNGAAFTILVNKTGSSIPDIFSGALTGSTNDFGSGLFDSGLGFRIDYNAGVQNDITLTTVVIPEPSALALAAAGLLICVGFRSYRR